MLQSQVHNSMQLSRQDCIQFRPLHWLPCFNSTLPCLNCSAGSPAAVNQLGDSSKQVACQHRLHADSLVSGRLRMKHLLLLQNHTYVWRQSGIALDVPCRRASCHQASEHASHTQLHSSWSAGFRSSLSRIGCSAGEQAAIGYSGQAG